MFPARIELAHLVPETSALSTELRELLFNHIINADGCEVHGDVYHAVYRATASVQGEHEGRPYYTRFFRSYMSCIVVAIPCGRHAGPRCVMAGLRHIMAGHASLNREGNITDAVAMLAMARHYRRKKKENDDGRRYFFCLLY